MVLSDALFAAGTLQVCSNGPMQQLRWRHLKAQQPKPVFSAERLKDL
jgi:hypothetical protein